jgi:hypothetical protein
VPARRQLQQANVAVSSRMEMSARDWSQQYESLKKRIQNQRINGIRFTADDKRLIEKQISILEVQLKTMSGQALQYELAPSEIARRELLLTNMKALTQNLFTGVSQTSSNTGTPGKLSSPYTSSTGTGGRKQQQQQTQEQIMKVQDEMVLEIGKGVGRLHGKALVIGEEAKAHVRLLDDLDSNVEIASAALAQEAKHAAETKDKGKVCYMYICIAVEVLVLVLMLALAFS